MPFLDQQRMRRQRHPLHTPKFFKDLPLSENLVRGAATWMTTTQAIFQL